MPKKNKKKWSQDVTEHSDAMDLKDGVFKSRSPKKIADSSNIQPRRAIAASRARCNRRCRC